VRLEALVGAHRATPAELPIAQPRADNGGEASPTRSEPGVCIRTRMYREPALELMLDTRIGIRAWRVGHVLPRSRQALAKLDDLAFELQASLTRRPAAVSSFHARFRAAIVVASAGREPEDWTEERSPACQPPRAHPSAERSWPENERIRGRSGQSGREFHRHAGRT
jgi:hypothetical protein